MEGYQLKQMKENFGYFLRGKASQLPDIADIAAVADIQTPNKMLDWRTNPNLILPTNIRVCPSTVYSDAGFSTSGAPVGQLWHYSYIPVISSCCKRESLTLFSNP